MRKKTAALLTCAAVAAASITSLAGCGSKGGKSSTQETVTVGLLHSLTGSMAISEGSVRDAEVLAIDEINAAGGVLGKQIKYIEERISAVNLCNKGRKASR